MLLPLPLPKGEEEGEGSSPSRVGSFQGWDFLFRLLTLTLSSLEEERRPFQRALGLNSAKHVLGQRITRRKRLLARRTAFALADFFQQLDLNLLNFEEPVVLPPEEVIDFLVQVPNLELGFKVDLVIVLRPQSITGFRPVLAHHDDGRLQRSQAGEDEIQQNERIRIEAAIEQEQRIEHDPDDDNAAESDDEFPAPAEL